MFNWIRDRVRDLTAQLWLQKWLGKVNKAVSDHKVEKVLVVGRKEISAYTMVIGAWLQTVSRILAAASEEDVRKMAPILGHFLRGTVSKISRGLHEEFAVAVVQLEGMQLDNWDLIQEAWETSEIQIRKAHKAVARNEASASELPQEEAAG